MEENIMPRIEIDGIGIVEVEDGFDNLSPQQQDAYVDQIINSSTSKEPSLLNRAGSAILGAPSAIQGTIAKTMAGIPIGLKNKAIGITQLGTEAYEKARYGDQLPLNPLSQELKTTASQRKAEQAELPATTKLGIGIGEVAPDIAVGMATRGALGPGKSLIQKALKLFGSGAASGASSELTEMQEESDLEDRLSSGASRAAFEGVLTTAFATTAKLGSLGWNFAKNVFSKGTPEQVAKEALNPIVAKEALEELSKAPKGKPTTGLDIQQPEFQQFARSVVARFPSSRKIALDFAEGRNAKALERIDADLTLLSKVDDAESYLAQLNNTKKALAEPLYKEAYKGSVPSSKVLEDPRLVSALNKAKKDFGINAPNNSVEAVHGARQVIDDIISQSFKNEERNKARAYSVLRNQVDNLLYKSRSFKDADKIYNKYSTLESAIQKGRDFTKSSPQEIQKSITDLKKGSKASLSEIKDSYRIGVRDGLVKEAQKAIKFEGNKIPTKVEVRSFIKDQFKKDQLKAIFPTESSFNKFVDNTNQEIIYNKIIKDLGLNKAAIEKDRVGFVKNAIAYVGSAALTGYGKTGAAVNAARVGEDILVRNYRNLNEKNAKAIANILTNKNATADLLEKVIKNAEPDQKAIVAEVAADLYPLIMTKTTTEEIID